MARRIAIIVGAVVLLLVLGAFLLVVDPSLARGPVAGYLSASIGQRSSVGSISSHLGRTSVFTLHDVRIDNPSWATAAPQLARIGAVEVTIAWGELIRQRHAARLVLRDFEIDLERKSPDQVNWSSKPQPKNSSGLPVQTVWFDNGRIHYLDAVLALDAQFVARPVHTSDAGDPVAAKQEASRPAQSTEGNPPSAARTLVTRIDFSGTYRQGRFSGSLGLGDTLGGDAMFPIDLVLNAGATRLDAQGRTDATLSHIDARLAIGGPTMANLYPFLLLPLPASPPYHVEGQLVRNDTDFAYRDFAGGIGETELTGSATYQLRDAKPYLNVNLHSHVLNFADLGPLVGIHGAPGANAAEAQGNGKEGESPPAKDQPAAVPVQGAPADKAQQLANGSAQTAKAVENADSPSRKVLPSGAFSGKRLQAIDADAKLSADQIRMPKPFAFESMSVDLHLREGRLTLEPLAFGFAGGTLDSTVTLNGNREPMAGTVHATVRQAHISRLFPTSKYLATSTGLIGATIDLQGTGDSVAALLGKSNGTAAAASSGGDVPSFLVDVIGLDAGALARHKVTGEDRTAIRCIATVFSVHDGDATADTIVVDTATTQITGTGDINFGTEGLALTFDPLPKKVSFPVARTPLHIDGTFAHPKVGVDKPSLALRGAAVLALAALNPIAAVLPLIHAPTGKDADCGALLAQAQPARAQEKAPSTAPAAPPASKGSRH
jgi:uncharacterized protein involved in outer membrane biogenesis